MRRNKPGLADLKKLRQETQPPDDSPPANRPKNLARKRSPFLPPASGPIEPKPVTARSGKAGAKKANVAPAQAHNAVKTGAGGPLGSDAPAVQLSETDRRLFRSAVRYVERIPDPGRVVLAPVLKEHPSILEERRKRAAGILADKPKKRQAPPDEKSPIKDEAGDKQLQKRAARTLSDNYAPATHDQDSRWYLKAGHGTDILRDLKRGKWPIGASLDLHGSNLEDARERFERFLDSCLTHGVKCVHIVHGKGYGSRNGDAVLKATVRRWLTQLDEVIAYTECSETDGGSGAVQVLLK